MEEPPDNPIHKRHPRYLPHWTRDGATYFVTFRLADSLPAPILQAWRREREDIIATARQMGRELSDHENQRLTQLHAEKVENYLDQGSGACYLKQPPIAELLVSALLHFAQEKEEVLRQDVVQQDVVRASCPQETIRLPSPTNLSAIERAGRMPAPHTKDLTLVKSPPKSAPPIKTTPRYILHSYCIMPNHVHVVVQPLPGNPLPDILHSWKSFTAKQANRQLKRTGQFWQEEYYDHLVRSEQDFYRVVRYTENNPRVAGLSNWPYVTKHPDLET